jgi:hypothetical protein
MVVHQVDKLTVLLVGFPLEFVQGNTRGEMFAIGIDHHHPHRGVLLHFPEGIIELPGKGDVEGVHRLRAIQRNKAYLIFFLYHDVGIAHNGPSSIFFLL